MRRLLFRIKNFWRYGKLGWQMHCSCCYDHLLDLVIERLKQMEGARHIVMGRENDVKNMRVVRTIFEKMRNGDYDWDKGIGMWKAKERVGLPWEEGYTSPISHIPKVVLTRHMQQEQREFQYAMDVMKRLMLRWWQ